MNYQIDEAVAIEFPDEDKRPFNRGTFLFQGFSVDWDTAPTTSENFDVFVKVPDFSEHEFLLVRTDPSSPSRTSWVHMVSNGPIAIPSKEFVKFVYPNTDGNLITLKVIGYYTNG